TRCQPHFVFGRGYSFSTLPVAGSHIRTAFAPITNSDLPSVEKWAASPATAYTCFPVAESYTLTRSPATTAYRLPSGANSAAETYPGFSSRFGCSAATANTRTLPRSSPSRKRWVKLQNVDTSVLPSGAKATDATPANSPPTVWREIGSSFSGRFAAGQTKT